MANLSSTSSTRLPVVLIEVVCGPVQDVRRCLLCCAHEKALCLPLERVAIRAAHLAGPVQRGLMALADAVLVAIAVHLGVVLPHLPLGDGEAHQLPLHHLTLIETGRADGAVKVEVGAMGEAEVRHNGGRFRWREVVCIFECSQEEARGWQWGSLDLGLKVELNLDWRKRW